ncbi:hypothetical protein DFH29DRAFT_1004322 [Suillus ampliporus]|nr:hypothetical protein DFH29DRAFT_1004322 [Suillus ampliporus]
MFNYYCPTDSYTPERPSRPSQSNQNFAPSYAYSQGFASQNAFQGSLITLPHQPPLQVACPVVHFYVIVALSIQAARADGRECPWYGVWAKVLQNYIFRGTDGLQTACTCIPQYSLVAAYDSGHLPEGANSQDSGLAASRSYGSDIDMGSPSSHWPSMSPGSPLPVSHFVSRNSTPNFSPRSQELFGGSPPPLTPSPQPQIPRLVSDFESPTTQCITRLQALAKDHESKPPVITHPFPQSPDDIPPSTPPRTTTSLSSTRVHKSSRIPDFVQILKHT